MSCSEDRGRQGATLPEPLEGGSQSSQGLHVLRHGCSGRALLHVVLGQERSDHIHIGADGVEILVGAIEYPRCIVNVLLQRPEPSF